MTPGAPGTMQAKPLDTGFPGICGCRTGILHEAAEVPRAFPRTPIVLNHTGFPWDRGEEGLAGWRRAIPRWRADAGGFSAEDRDRFFWRSAAGFHRLDLAD
jgi:hypothetical protein